MTKHSRSYSYAGKSWPYQVISPNLVISFGNAVRISLRNEDPAPPLPPPKKVPGGNGDVMLLFEAIVMQG